jgi:hypothetical protein
VTDFISFQVITLLFAAFSAIEEAAFTFPFRTISDEAFPWPTKAKKLKVAHRSGWLGVGSIMFCFGWIHGLAETWKAGLLCFGVCLLIYWLVFDILFSLAIRQKWHYLGSTAGTDKGLMKVLGKNAGQLKALFCLVAIITINLIYKQFV